MIRRAVRVAVVAVGLAVSFAGAGRSPAQSNAPATSDPVAVREKAGCSNNLVAVYAAIQAYQRDKRDIPNWLSDLVPQYLSDPAVLTCPVCLRTGRTEPPPLADPKISSSYLYEFCPVPLGGALTNAPERTRREWKRRQMGLVGSAVPIVRCRHHGGALNVGFNGKIYESPAQWELAYTNLVRFDDLSPARLFAGESARKPAGNSRSPARDSRAQPGLTNSIK